MVIGLDIGLPESIPFYTAHDLDNYLLEVARGPTRYTGRPFASAWATKQHASESHS